MNRKVHVRFCSRAAEAIPSLRRHLERSGELRGRAVGRQSEAEGDGEIRDLGRKELTAESLWTCQYECEGAVPAWSHWEAKCQKRQKRHNF